jgi:hypothetical protein
MRLSKEERSEAECSPGDGTPSSAGAFAHLLVEWKLAQSDGEAVAAGVRSA